MKQHVVYLSDDEPTQVTFDYEDDLGMTRRAVVVINRLAARHGKLMRYVMISNDLVTPTPLPHIPLRGRLVPDP